MDQLPLHVRNNIATSLDVISLSSLSRSCKELYCNDILWKLAFLSYRPSLFKCYQEDYVSFINNKPNIRDNPSWYKPKKSYLQLYLFLKEIEKRGAKIETKNNLIYPYFKCQESKAHTFLYCITPSGDLLQFYSLYDSYENTSFWIVLTLVNGVDLFLPLLSFHYQHGAGWFGVVFPFPIRVSYGLLGVKDLSDEEFTTKMVKLIANNEYVNISWKQFIATSKKKELVVKNTCTHYVAEDGTLSYLYGMHELPYIKECASRTFERLQREREEKARIEKRGPVTDEELEVWEKFVSKADKGHKDDQFAKEWAELMFKVKSFPLPHLQFLASKVRSDLGRTLLWCCASRGWTEEAKWALELGADPLAEAGKGSAYDIAKHYKRTKVLQLFDDHISKYHV